MPFKLFLIALLSLMPSVDAINEYNTIANAPKPATCGNSGVLPGGGWIANKRCGYIMGTAVAGRKFDVESTDSTGYHYGRYRGTGGNFCTFLIPSSLDLSSQVSGIASSCSTTTSSALCNRQHFGIDFDSPPHQGDGAITVPINLGACSGFYNYFVDSNFVSGAFQDPVPFSLAATSSAGYRYTTRDGQASMLPAVKQLAINSASYDAAREARTLFNIRGRRKLTSKGKFPFEQLISTALLRTPTGSKTGIKRRMTCSPEPSPTGPDGYVSGRFMIVLRNITIKPLLSADIPSHAPLFVQLTIGQLVLDETEPVQKDDVEADWKLPDTFLIPIVHSSFIISVISKGIQGGLRDIGSIQIDVGAVAASAAERETLFVVKVKNAAGGARQFELSFTAVLTTSNLCVGPSPESVITAAASLSREGIIALLTQIVISDATCMNADLGLLNTMFGVLLRLPSHENKSKAQGLGLLANIHLARYDIFLKSVDDEPKAHPLYEIYAGGLKMAVSMLKGALSIAENDHPKRPWLMVTLSMCLQRRLLQEATDTTIFNSTVHKMQGVVPNIPDNEPNKPLLSHYLGVVLKNRFLGTGDVADLEASILALDDAVRLTPNIAPTKSTFLTDLSSALSSRFELLNHPADISRSLLLREDALRLTPDDDPTKPAELKLLGHAFFLRFEQFCDLDHINKSILAYEDALRLTEDSHRERPFLLNNLSASLSLRCKKLGPFGNVDDLRRSVSLIEDAIQVAPDEQTKFVFMVNLGNSLHSQIKRTLDITDVKRYSEVAEATVHLASDSDPNQVVLLEGFVDLIESNFNEFCAHNVIDQLLVLFQSTINILPDDHDAKPMLLHKMAFFLFRGFEVEPVHIKFNIDRPMVMLEEALGFISPKDPRRSSWTSTLAQFYLRRFILIHDLSDVQKSFDLSNHVLQLVDDEHPERPFILHTLANSQFHLSESSSSTGGIKESLIHYKNALEILPEGHTESVVWSVDFGIALLRNFEVSGRLEDLNDSVDVLEEAANGLHNNHYARKRCLDNLSHALFCRFNKLLNFKDLDAAMKIMHDHAFIAPDGNSGELFDKFVDYFRRFLEDDKDIEASALEFKKVASSLTVDEAFRNLRLRNLSLFFSIRLKIPGDLGNIDQTILDILEDGVKLLPDHYPHKIRWFIMLGNLLALRFRRHKENGGLDRAICLFEQAIKLASKSNGQPFNAASYLSYGTSLHERYVAFGDLADLNQAINILQSAVHLCPDADPVKYLLSDSLGNTYLVRFKQLGDIADFDKSVQAFHDGLIQVPTDHKDRAALQRNIGFTLIHRLKLVGNPDDADQAISIFQQDLQHDIVDQDATEKINKSIEYSEALLHRFWHFRDSSDVNEAITFLQNIAGTTSEDHPSRNSLMHSVGSALSQRFVQLGDLDDINGCISAYQEANRLTPNSHPLKYSILFDLGRWLPARYERLHDVNDLENAEAALSAAILLQAGPTRARFRIASLLGYWRQYFMRPGSLEAYASSMQFLPKLAWLGLSIPNRHFQLLEVGEVILDSVAAAIEASRYDLAVEWLEYGRSIVWGQLVQLRSPLNNLRQVHPELADRLEDLSEKLDRDGENYDSNTSPQDMQHFHDLALERDLLVEKVRLLEGFQGFLRPPIVSDLLHAAKAGPVVAVNVSGFRSDALILVPQQEKIIHVPLPDFPATEARRLLKTLQDLLRSKNALRGEDRAARRSPFAKRDDQDPEVVFESILSTLWKCVAKPILEALGITVPAESPRQSTRIWWCLTGPMAFLPIHAAGLYGKDSLQPGSKLSDFVLSSYTPSFSALINSLKAREVPSRKVLTVALPDEARLPASKHEIEMIHKHNDQLSVSSLMDSQATLENVVLGMHECGWVHFACHGIQDISNSINSALILTEGSRLTLSQISRLQLAHAELAFLSACQTATGDELLPEEAVHLAAGMLSAGYRGVIGTMWSIPDSVAPQIAEDVYSHLFGGPAVPDAAGAACALHFAVKRLRENPVQKPSFFAWVPFVHYGADPNPDSTRRLGSPFLSQLSHMLSLPFELLLIIFSILRQPDIARVARVCSAFLPVARYLIYQDLLLREDDSSLSLILDILKDNDMSSRVRKLRFKCSTTKAEDESVTTPKTDTPTVEHWFERLLSSMTGLVELTLVGYPFSTSQEQGAFVSTIQQSCPSLRAFTYRPNKTTTFPKDSTNLDIGGLQKIVWYSPRALSHENQAISLMSASLASLTDLRILKCSGPDVTCNLEQWNTLLSFRFPSLTSLSIGYHPELYTASETWIQFLVDHPLLQHFSLGANLPRAQYMTMADQNTRLIKEDFLPNLCSLETHHTNIRLLANFGVRSLRQISSLTILKAYYQLTTSSIRTFDLLDDLGGFPLVTKLHIEVKEDDIDYETRQRLLNERMARAFPSVKSWSSNMRLNVDKDELSTFFSYYKNLETIEAPRVMILPTTTPSSSLEVITDYLSPLTSNCPNLREICVPESSSVSELNREGAIYVITRCHEEDGLLINIRQHSL
ncbi:hypothetical protein GALMADRAFT_138707 [Galerina marginata CBS 339.88]|uniref:F-box domain-containing protein n=1 Tax=Galerina marginata (strain CBS 339.88) TaxID=685588 RepID=A0A067T366_GALM3|nr:hypothetical protein GALMADRAFT_138707 [Galerina marginata CBS 339.88]